MTEILKISTIGVDTEIDRFQKKLHSLLGLGRTTMLGNWESNHRCYMIPNQNGRLTPHVYTSNGNYREVFTNDRFDCTSFFVVDPVRDINNGFHSFDFSIIFQSILPKIFPSIAHRADEEMTALIERAIAKTTYSEYLSKISTGIDDCYREFDRSQIELNDMSKYHVVRFEFKNVGYNPQECCENC